MTGTLGWNTDKRLTKKKGWLSAKKLRIFGSAGALALAVCAGPAIADVAYKVTSIISLPGGQQITSVDIGFTDPVLSLYAIADRKNKSIDVIDTKTNTVLFQAVGFCGLAGATPSCGGTFATEAGPNGVIFVDHKEVWGADADSSIKVVDLQSRAITHVIPLGLTKRADELCHDPVDNLVLIASDKDAAIQFIDTKTYTNVTNTASKKIVLDGTAGYPNATNGIEQCQYNPRNGLFYLAVPEVSGAGNDQTPGAVLVINPLSQRVVATFSIPLTACAGPQGLTIGPAPQILLGCSNNGTSTALIDDRDGHVLAAFQGLIGNDEVYFNSTDNHYFLAESNAPTPQLGVIDALTMTAAPSIPTGGSDHSVAADPSTGNVYVPIVSGSSNICSTFAGSDANGCIAVFSSAGGPAKIVAAIAPSTRTSGVSGTLGTPVTAFASIINAGTVTANKCSIQLPAGVQADFKYQTTDPATNVPTGTANTPVDIAAGATKTFYFAITPTAFFSQDIPLVFVCDNTDPAPSIPGLNTFLLTVTNPAISDMLMITDSPSHDGFINVPGTAGTGLMVAAAVNLGTSGTVTFTPLDTPFGQAARNLALALNICQTTPSGACLATPSSSVTATVNNGQIVTFSIFVTGRGTSIATNPGFSRVFLVATQGTSPVGEASAAVKFVAGPSS